MRRQSEPRIGVLPAASHEDAVWEQLVEVRGTIAGGASAGLTVQVVERVLTGGAMRDRVVAEGEVDADGAYRLRYERAAHAAPSAVLLVVRDAAGEPLAESYPVPAPGARVRIDVRLPEGSVPEPSEYASLSERVAALEVDVTEVEPDALEELAAWLDVDAALLATFAEATALARASGLPAELAYALARGGVSLAPRALIEVPAHALRATVEAAIADEIVSPALAHALDAHLGALAEHVRARLLESTEEGDGAVAIIARAALPTARKDALLRAYQRGRGAALTAADEAQHEAQHEAADDAEAEAALDAQPALREALELAALIGDDPALIALLQAERREGRWQRLEDLTSLSAEAWSALLAAAEGDAGEDDEDDEASEARAERAEQIADALEQAFPSAAIRRRLRSEGLLSESAYALLEQVGEHDFTSQSLRSRIEDAEVHAAEDVPPEVLDAALEEVEAVERISRITPRAAEVAALLGAGVRSAHAIARQPQRRFIAAHAEALGGRAQAARVHAQSQQRAAAGMLTALRLHQGQQQQPFVLGGAAPAQAADASLRDLPGLGALFGGGGLCECDQCGSVYSPAAYYVDLLQYLDVTARDQRPRGPDAARHALGPSGASPLQILLSRRPDLADVPLSCGNTLTPLPYLDLVNEILEARVAGGSAAHDTGKTPADVLRAIPQHVDRAAYAQLQTAVHPLQLPFHEPLAVTRAYLGHLGVTRLELLRSFGSGAREAQVAEALGLSPEALALIAQPIEAPYRHVGFETAQVDGRSYLDALAHVPMLLAAVGVSYGTLIELTRTRFLNHDDALQLVVPDADCDPERVRVAGLDEARLERLLRFVRAANALDLRPLSLDRVLAALGARALSLDVLEALVDARELARALELPLDALLVLWAPLDTFGDASPFEKLVQTREVAYRTAGQDPFALRPDRRELRAPRDDLDAVAPALLAALRVTSDELAHARALLVRRAATLRLDLAGLSALARVVLLARALKLRIGQLALLLRLAPPDADPFRAGDPGATRRFVALVRDVQSSELTPEQLGHLLGLELDARSDPGPRSEQIDAVLAGIRRGLADALAAAAHPADRDSEVLRQKLALYVDPAQVEALIEALDPRTQLAEARRGALFDRFLAPLFPDAAAARAQLIAPPRPREASEDDEAVQTAVAGEAALQERARFVLTHLLPVLRARGQRGAVVQALSDALGISAASTGRLLEQVLQSRAQPGRPLRDDFFALIGAGLTGAYFDDASLEGEPRLRRTDAELAFAWGDAGPGQPLPARRFGVRWRGGFLPRASGPHRFVVRSDGAVRLTLTDARGTHVLIEQADGAPAARELASPPIALEASAPSLLTLEYRNLGAPPSLVLALELDGAARQPIPTGQLYAEDQLRTLTTLPASYRRLARAALLLSALRIGDAQLGWLVRQPSFLALDALPDGSGPASEPVQTFQRVRQLIALYRFLRALPASAADPFEVFSAESLDEALDRLARVTGWERTVLGELAGARGLALDLASLRPSFDQAAELPLVRLGRALALQRRTGVAPGTLRAWAERAPDAEAAAQVVQAVRARYDEKRWLEVARSLNDPLRVSRREALVAFLLPRMRAQGVKTRAQLFEYFLIDVDTSACMLTSRIRQAIGSVQTFFQRCLMNLERVNPRLLSDDDWKWLKNYRTWEANRKIFLYAENWIEPELLDRKSPQLAELERAILQQEIRHENVEAAFVDYLQSLAEIARLEVRAAFLEPRVGARERFSGARSTPASTPPRDARADGTYHVFARTPNAPHVWYYRKLERGRTWTAWERLDVDVEGELLLPFVFQRRLHLAWTVFREATKPTRPPADRDAAPTTAGKDWEIQLAYSVYDRGRWSRKRLAPSVRDVVNLPLLTLGKDKKPRIVNEGSATFPQGAYALRAVARRGDVQLTLLRRKLDCTQLRAKRGARLAATETEWVAELQLDGCSGALELLRQRPASMCTPAFGASEALTPSLAARLGEARRGRPRRPAPARPAAPPSPPPTAPGVPVGYVLDGMGYAPERGRVTALLALRPHATHGVHVVLGARALPRRVRVVPVLGGDASAGLAPFFYQDARRCYFVRPVPADGKVALRVPPARALLLGPRVVARPAPRKRKGLPARLRGRRREDADEALHELDAESVAELAREEPEALDFLEDVEDAAWHEDDAAERRVPRKKRGRSAVPARAAVRAAPRPAMRARTPAPVPIAERLRFTPFEHAEACALLRTVKSEGIAALFERTVTRPHRGEDHGLVKQRWTRNARTRFEADYAPGPLADARHPALDVDFSPDHPAALYNWEIFFHAPLLVAVRLAKEGRHEEAQRWFHFIFDPTSDVSAPAPGRYWRFAPFREHDTPFRSARALIALLGYQGNEPTLARQRDNVTEELVSWWEKPFQPHVIARLRIAAYQKAVVMKYCDNLIEGGDKLYRRDTMESIHEAIQLYVLAASILGPRSERVQPAVSTEPLTFRRAREGKIDAFSNFLVRFESRQVKRPFRIDARPEMGAVSSLLGMATPYFCVPSNPQMDKYWDTIADRLFKIRNCMNIQGVVRTLPLFDPPIDPGLLARAAALGADLGSVLSSLNAPPPQHRFRFLFARALRMAEELRGFGQSALRVLERRDAEALAALRASHESGLVEAAREVRKKEVRQVEAELAELSVEREHVELQIQYKTDQLKELMSAQESASQKSLSVAQVVSGIAEGVDLVSKVMYAIPEMQAGTAGGFSSPFVTLQLGGQMFGDISAAFAESLQKVMSRSETEADMAAAQAEYQRRRAEWQHELDLLNKDKTQLDKRMAEVQLKLEIRAAELAREERELEAARGIERFLREKYTSEQLYGWMLSQLSVAYFAAYKLAFDTAQQCEQALRFEHGEPAAKYLEFSYWDSLKKGLLAGERLLLDLRRMESAYLERDRRTLEVTRHVSLRRDFPAAYAALIGTGSCRIELSEPFWDADFAGHYFRRVKTVSLSVRAARISDLNVHSTLTLLESRIRVDANASGSYPPSDAHDARFVTSTLPAQAVAISRPGSDAGLFECRLDDDRYLPFEGAGAVASFRLDVRQADNALNLSDVEDFVLTVAYTARAGGPSLESAARRERERALGAGTASGAQVMVSLRHDHPDLLRRLREVAAGESVEGTLELAAERLSGRLRGLEVRLEKVTAYLQTLSPLGDDAVHVQLTPPSGAPVALGSWSSAWPGSAARRAGAELNAAAGRFKLSVKARDERTRSSVDDVVLIFDLRARRG